MDYLKMWIDNLMLKESISIDRNIQVDGIRNKHLGPRIEYAKVKYEIGPSDQFSVDFSKLKTNLSTDLNGEQVEMLNFSIFGLLDILMINNTTPIKKINIIFLEADFDIINSNRMAFRNAGRDAGEKIIKIIKGI